MTTEENPVWPPAIFANQWKNANEEAMEMQAKLFRQLLSQSVGTGTNGYSPLSGMGLGTATFKCRVQSGGRISIPDAEREALDINEGDIVQTIVFPIKRNTNETNE